MSDSGIISAGQAISTRLNWGTRLAPLTSQHVNALDSESKEHSSERPQKNITTPFSDEEIDQLLKKVGMKPDENLRQAAKFLMRHHFNLERPLLELANKLLPEGPWEEHGPAEALVAALSRLPLEEGEAGFHILMTAFHSKHPTVMALIHHLIAQIQDLASLYLVDPENGIPAQMMLDALDEEVLLWKGILDSPQLQMHMLVQRGELLNQLRRLHLFFKLSLQILELSGCIGEKPIIKHLRSLQRDLRHAIELLVGDMILSKEDEKHHFREQGQCSTLGLWADSQHLPCRLWSDGDQAEDESPQEAVWSFRFHWHDDIVQHIEAEVQVWKEDCEVNFQCDDPEVRELLDAHRVRLEAQLRNLGYDPKLHSCSELTPKTLDLQAELHGVALNDLHHVDSEA